MDSGSERKESRAEEEKRSFSLLKGIFVALNELELFHPDQASGINFLKLGRVSKPESFGYKKQL